MKDSLYQFLSRTYETNRINRFLSAGDFLQLDAYLTEQRVRPGEVVFRENDPSDFVAFLADGRIKLTRQAADSRTPVLIGLLNAGAILGEMCLVDGAPRVVTATAIEESCLLLLPRQRYDDLLRDNPALSSKVLQLVMNTVGHRLRLAYERLARVL